MFIIFSNIENNTQRLRHTQAPINTCARKGTHVYTLILKHVHTHARPTTSQMPAQLYDNIALTKQKTNKTQMRYTYWSRTSSFVTPSHVLGQL